MAVTKGVRAFYAANFDDAADVAKFEAEDRAYESEAGFEQLEIYAQTQYYQD
jgi:hypothetical protein